MRVEKAGEDYYVYFTDEQIDEATTPISTLGGFKYNPMDVVVSGTREIMDFMCTNDSSIINDKEKSHNRIYFDRDEEGPIVRIFTPLMLSLLKGSEQFFMTRYDGYNKIFFYRED